MCWLLLGLIADFHCFVDSGHIQHVIDWSYMEKLYGWCVFFTEFVDRRLQSVSSSGSFAQSAQPQGWRTRWFEPFASIFPVEIEHRCKLFASFCDLSWVEKKWLVQITVTIQVTILALKFKLKSLANKHC